MRILVIIDMQNDFLTGTLGSPDEAAIVPNVVKKIRDEHWDEIYYTLDTHPAQSYASSTEGACIPPHCIEETEGWRLNPEVGKAVCAWATRNGRLMPEGIRKPTFGSALLPAFFTHCDPDDTEVVFIGVCTDICVISNVLLLKANYPEFHYTVDASCCAGSSQHAHRAALEVMKSCLVSVVND